MVGPSPVNARHANTRSSLLQPMYAYCRSQPPHVSVSFCLLWTSRDVFFAANARSVPSSLCARSVFLFLFICSWSEYGSPFRSPVRSLVAVEWVQPSEATPTPPSLLSCIRTHPVASLSAVVVFLPYFSKDGFLVLGMIIKPITTTPRGPSSEQLTRQTERGSASIQPEARDPCCCR